MAYKVLMQAQQTAPRKVSTPVAILSLNKQLHLDYIQRCQVDLASGHLPALGDGAGGELLLYLAAGQMYRFILVDSVSDLLAGAALARQLPAR
ncbi:MAG: hypothetical protein R2911_39170 [Caldilineaceae bacterium]